MNRPGFSVIVVAVFICLGAAAVERVPMERMAAFHRSIVATHETDVTSAFMTYFKSHPEQVKHDFLVKIVPCLEKGEIIPAPGHATDVRVEDFPGGVRAVFRLDGVEVTADIAPLLVGRGVQTWEGAAVYSITTNPPTPVALRIGGGTSVSFLTGSPAAFIGADTVAPKDAQVIDGRIATFQSGEDPFSIAVCSTSTIERNADTGQLAARFANGSGALVIAYADAADRALELSKSDPQAARKAVDEYYAKLLESRIKTPDANLNAAFRSAIMTLEYSWIEPYGWMETIHHWMAMWHMQHTAGAEWLGQEDRSRACTLTHGHMLLPNGAVPQLWPNGQVHRDFGGSNQFWAWQVRHYLDFTGDQEFAKEVAPMVDKVVKQTFAEYDPDGNTLLAWSQQIGNQEDMIGTPYDGTAPTVEGINLMRTFAACLSASGASADAAAWAERANLPQRRMRDKLWMPDLGRYAFFTDPTGHTRLDGQYHSLIYPTLFLNAGDAHPLEQYLALRHLLDRLSGPAGGVYCSNNFPNHVSGTWGMQTGAAQQPWAAWALGRAGMREQAWKPLKAVADRVMDANHRGSWPEVAQEPIPAYFSPPAGLFIASLVESVFGLRVVGGDRLEIAPCFPDAWNKAALHLPGFDAEFERDGNRLRYRVNGKKAFVPEVNWSLPVSNSKRLTINGASVQTVDGSPCVAGTMASTAKPAEARESDKIQAADIVIEYEPAPCEARYPHAVAEGEAFDIELHGNADVIEVIDPCHVLQSSGIEGLKVCARLSPDLLKPYAGYGRLGLMNFARRTFFLKCRIRESAETVLLPVDLTVLPRVEAAFTGDLRLDGNGAAVPLLLRNNTAKGMPIVGSIGTPGLRQPINTAFDGGRCERSEAIAISADRLTQLSPGENDITVAVNTGGGLVDELHVTLNARTLFESGPFAAHAASRMAQIPLPEDKMVPDTHWRRLREFPGFPHVPWANSPPALEKLEGKTELAPPDLPQVKFTLPRRKFIPVSYKMNQPSFTLDLQGRTVKKLYVLVIPYLDNHDMFSEVARMTVRGDKDAVLYSRTLRTPGDLDWWPSADAFGEPWSTARHGRTDRHGLLPLLKEGETDWPIAHPPAFPQPEYWATCLPIVTGSCTMNVVELDLGQSVPVRSLTIETLGATPALGVVAVTAEGSGDDSLLDGTPWEVPVERRRPRTVFSSRTPDPLNGWELKGNAFSSCAFPSLFSEPTLNSLGKAGEQATGEALSPAFELRPTDKFVVLEIQGGRSVATPEGESLCAELVEAATGQVLGRVLAPGVHALQTTAIAVHVDKPTQVRLRLIDRNADAGYAWIGVASVCVSSAK